MQKQISIRGVELTDELEGRIEALMQDLAARTEGVQLAKFVVEKREASFGVGVVLSWGEKKDTVVRHAEATDWDRAFLDLARRLERALEETPEESS